MAATNGAAAANGLPEDPIILRARLAEVEARYAESQVQFRELRTWYDKLKRQHRELLWSEAVLAREGLEEALPGPPVADADRANGHIGSGFVSNRVGINQFLGDDAAVLARSSGDFHTGLEAPPRRRRLRRGLRGRRQGRAPLRREAHRQVPHQVARGAPERRGRTESAARGRGLPEPDLVKRRRRVSLAPVPRHGALRHFQFTGGRRRAAGGRAARRAAHRAGRRERARAPARAGPAPPRHQARERALRRRRRQALRLRAHHAVPAGRERRSPPLPARTAWKSTSRVDAVGASEI